MKSVTLLLLITTAGAVQHCPDSWSAFDGQCYALSTFVAPWVSGEDICDLLQEGARPASVHNLEVNAHLEILLNGTQGWIGLGRQGGSDFSWQDDSEVDFLYWGANEPGSDDCVLVSNNMTGQWAAVDCSELHLTICQIQPQPEPPASCPDGWSEYNNTCYWHSGDMSTEWAQIGHECQSLQPSGEPVSIHSLEQNAFLFSLIDSYSYTWIGLIRDTKHNPDIWVWTDSSPVDYYNWRSGGYPNDGYNCGVMFNDDATWYAESCVGYNKPFFCQTKK